MASNYIIDVTEADFEYEVIAYSQKVPVVVDFWAEWCAPCRVLGPLLEKLAREGQGAFRLAKIDVDKNQSLAERFNVRSIPAVKAFQNGRIVGEFAGAVPEPRLREFIDSFAPSEDGLALEKGKSQLNNRKVKEAEATFKSILDKNPNQPAAKLGFLKCQLLQGLGAEAMRLIETFPASRELNSAYQMLPLAQALISSENASDKVEILGVDPLQAAYNNAIRLVKIGNLEAAMDGILDILRQDKKYRNGAAKDIFLGMLELLGNENPETRQYRSELASVLF